MRTLIKSAATHPRAVHALRVASAVAIGAALSACGGSAGGSSEQTSAQSTSISFPQSLFDENGRAYPSKASMVPAETTSRTRSGLYVTNEQMDWEELMYGPVTVVLDIDRMGMTEAVARAKAIEARRKADISLGYFVRAANAEDVAAVVNELTDAGLRNVFAVKM
jgi:hypothetical protein